MVLLRYGDNEKKLALVAGKIHIATFEKLFKLHNIELDGTSYPPNSVGLTYTTFCDDVPIVVTGNPAAGMNHQLLSPLFSPPCAMKMSLLSLLFGPIIVLSHFRIARIAGSSCVGVHVAEPPCCMPISAIDALGLFRSLGLYNWNCPALHAQVHCWTSSSACAAE